MPGILPMKVIKVGTSSQGRIAQACDRCRSKKIRCDGVRPTCTQCSSVGFECRTSDKLSRRAFPRGYTESLEERVRQLEGEVRELKDLLDEKDEKIDMLSKLHGNRRCHSSPSATAAASSSAQSSPDAITTEKKKDSQPREETFKVQASPLLLGVENSDSYFMGPSSGRSFIESFKRKMQEVGKPAKDFNVEAFLHIQGCLPLMAQDSEPEPSRMPPRLFTDRCVNVFFQEWAPLFPVLHKPTFLRVYEEFVLDPEKVKSSHKLTQLYLVFSIAGLASESPDLPQLVQCERHWQETLDAVIMENTMNTLQCLVLALLYCTMRADYKRLQHYKGIAVSLSHRLGLHQNQKRFSFGALTTETRKKVFWTLYTLDCFTAATLGLPKLLRESDVHAEYPSDADDEYVSERGFQPTLPGEYTRLSNALALFRVARILARVLEKNYPATTTQDLSLQDMYNLEAELDAWHAELPPHLRLNFKQDKPSTDITGSRSPLLALTYYFVRVLIFRPAIGSTLGPKAAPALLSIGESSKHIIQVAQLLEERNMTFAFCVNKHDLLTVCGLTLLYQAIDLAKTSKVRRDDERLVNSVVKSVVKAKAPGSIDFKRIATLLIDVDSQPDGSSNRSQQPKNDSSSVSPTSNPSGRKLSHGFDSKSSSNEDLRLQQEKLRRVTMPNPRAARPDPFKSRSRQSFDSRQDTSSTDSHQAAYGQTHPGRPRPNLDYLSLSNTPSQSQPQTPGSYARASQTSGFTNRSGAQNKLDNVSPSEWEALLGSMDGGLNNVYNAIYGGQGFMADSHITATDPAGGGGTSGKPTASNGDWSSDPWDLSAFNLNDFGDSGQAGPQSVLSLSDESLSSGEEVAPSELGLSVGSVDFHGGVVPSSTERRQQQQQSLNGIFLDLEGYSL